MSPVEVVEISAISPLSFEDAIKRGIAGVNQVLSNVQWLWMKKKHVRDTARSTSEYHVSMQVAFVLESS